MLKDKLSIDEKDVKLLTILMHSPHSSQSDLAQELSLSQPSVNVRMRKLRERGVLSEVVGINALKAGVSLVRVDFTCSNPSRVLSTLSQCSFFVNGLLLSGTRNVSVYIIGENLGKIEFIVTQYLRSSPVVSNIELSVVVETIREFVCAVDLEKEHTYPCTDPEGCEHCQIRH